MTEGTPTNEAGGSMLEYMMVMAFVAVIAIIGLRTIGPAAAGMFDSVTGGFDPPAAIVVLGERYERPAPEIKPVALMGRCPSFCASPAEAW